MVMIGGILEELYIPTSLYSRHPLVEMEYTVCGAGRAGWWGSRRFTI